MLAAAVSFSNRESIFFWDKATGVRIRRIDRPGTNNHERFVAFLPGSETVLETSGPIIRFWDSITGKEKPLPEVTRSNLEESNRGACLSRDGALLAQINYGEVGVWEVSTGRKMGPEDSIYQTIDAVAFSPDDKRLATLSRKNGGPRYKLRLWNADTGQPEKIMDDNENGCPLNEALDYSDGSHIEALEYGDRGTLHTLIRWDTRTGKASNVAVPITEPQNGSHIYVTSLRGRLRAFGLSENGVAIVDRLTNKEVRRFTNLGKEVLLPSVSISMDGRSVLSVFDPITVWSTATGKQLLNVKVSSIRYQGFELPPVALSPDGRRMAAVVRKDSVKPDGSRLLGELGGGSTIRLWEVASGTEGKKIEAGELVNVLAWSPGGRFLAGGDDKGDLHVWDSFTGREVCHFRGHRTWVKSLGFSPGGLRLASGSYDTTALVWNLGGLTQTEAQAEHSPKPEKLWELLRKKDATQAWHAMHLLIQNPDETLPLLRERLRQSTAPIPDEVAALLTQLDDNDFYVRKRAEERLEKMQERVESALQQAMTKKPHFEGEMRIKRLLEKISGEPPMSGLYPSDLQAVRAVEVLERIGTRTARDVLEEISRLPREYVQSEEAKASLCRLTKSASAPLP